MITFGQLGRYGRIGNCLFQISSAIGHAERVGTSYQFPLWPSAHYFSLGNCFSNNLLKLPIYQEPEFSYRPLPHQINLNLHGYFQSEKYFSHCSDKIRQLLAPSQPVEPIHAISLHVRRTDYLTLEGCFAQLGMDYYQAALEQLPDLPVLVFSDDLPWCRQHFIGDRFSFSEGHTPEVDLHRMSFCTHHVIANSSFSWWGAWLNPNLAKRVIAPSQWFGPKLVPTHDTKDLIPESWIKI